MAPRTLDLSPSVCHHRWLKETQPAFAYDQGDVGAWQRKLRRKLRSLLGAMPAERVPLRVRSLWQQPHEHGTIEKIVFTSEPGCDVPAYVCLPKGVEPPYRFFICVQGHSSGMHNSIGVEFEDNQKPMAVEGDRDFAIGCMQRGLAALCLEQRSFGERRENVIAQPRDDLCYQATCHALALGRTLVGERVWDVDRGIDYLAHRGDAQLKHIGLMGNSGGGTVTLFASAVLPRIAYAMPSCYFCTFRDSIMSIFHCLCNYVPGILPVAEMAEVAGLIAPRPLVIVAGKEDPIFPIQAVRKEYKRLRRIYKAAGAEKQLRLVEGAGGHRFYADDAWPVMQTLMGHR